MQKFAVFDIDGTLIRWQLYHAIVDRLAKHNMLGHNAKDHLHDARMHWKQRQHINSFRNYELVLIQIFESALHNISPEVFDNVVTEIIQEYKNQVYIYTRDLIKNLRAQNYFLLAISGSHHELVEQIAKTYHFDDFIGSRYERDKQSFTGRKFIASADKGSILKQFIAKHNLLLDDSIGVGDSESDAAFLRLVKQPVAFNPDLELYKLAREEKWKIVIERKNVIYELQPENHAYQLK